MSVLTLRPNSSIVWEQLTPGYGNDANYAMVDEVTLDESDYCGAVEAVQETKLDIYGFPNHTSESGVINSITIKLKGKYVLNGTMATAATVRFAIRISGTDYYGSTQNLLSATTEMSEVWAKRPSDNADWSWTDVDNLTAGDSLTNAYSSDKNYKLAYSYQVWAEIRYGEAAGGSLLLPIYRKPFRHMLIR